ncbi:MAG TPA: hypothetical protein VNI01_01600, partial [Elusimicrobiota bacterium]|nr:hypothetical protein [Elusimicrobiota bacterium]
MAASSAWAAPAQPDKKPGTPDGNTKPDLVGVCKADVKTPRRMIEHGFHWMKDPAVAMKLSEKFASYLACAAKVEGKDPCKAVDAMAPVYKFDKEMGTMLQQCKDMDQYVDFYHEMMTAPRKSRKFPACTEYLGTLGSPMIKIFDTTAIAPP